MRARLMNAVSYHEGVKHLDGKKFPVLSKIELEDARKKANQLLTFDTEQYKKAVLFLNNNYQ